MLPDSQSPRLELASFPPGVVEKLGFYVYLLMDPRDNSVFYVGKGIGDRCFAHVAEARKTEANSSDDYTKLARIREIQDAGESVRIDILRHGLTEREAFLIESATIDVLDNLTNRVFGYGASLGRMSVMDISALYRAEAVTIDAHHRVVLIRISRLFSRGMSDEQRYETTRKWWPVGRQRRERGSPLAPDWAMAVFGGVVRAVHRIDSWEQPSDEDILSDPKYRDRWAFRGERDLEMEGRYVFRDVSRYLRSRKSGHPSQFPLSYVHCSVVD